MDTNPEKSMKTLDQSQTGRSWKDRSPEDVHTSVREKVAKGVAAIAGAIKGFTEEAKRQDLANSSREAMQQAGQTTREITQSAKKEYQDTKKTFKGGQGGPQSMGGSASTTTADVPDVGHTPLGTQSDIKDSERM